MRILIPNDISEVLTAYYHYQNKLSYIAKKRWKQKGNLPEGEKRSEFTAELWYERLL